MELHTIKTEEEYNGAMAMIDSLINAPENSEDSEKLELFSILVEDYENKYYKMEMPDPIEAIKQRAEQLGLTRKDLEQSIGSRARVSEILNKKRNLTLPMIRKLSKNLNIPADILIKETKREVA
jgi:HTH-type transcriptional regulator / antitoxin HigA